MKLFRIGILLGLSLVVLASCKSSKSASGGRGRAGALTASSLYETLSADDGYKWLTGKARMKATTPDMRVSGSMQLRMVRDSVVWVMVEKFGFEVARVKITPDSIFIVDRLNKQYTEESLQSYLEEYGVQMNFRDLQKTLLGKMIALIPEQLDFVRESEFDVLAVRDRYGVNARHWIVSANPPRLMRSQFVDARGRSLNIENAEWQSINGTLVPYTRFLVLDDGDEETAIEMSFTELVFDKPTSMPFSIPSNYARVR